MTAVEYHYDVVAILPYKFTGKERDSETGLDMFGARYYASTMGRFMTPDWAAKPTSVPYAQFGDPQSLNLYGYVRNNPLSRIDQDGHSDWFDAKGHRLGTDGVNDGGVVIVRNAQSVKYSPDHSVIDVSASGTPIASFTRSEGVAMHDAVARSNAPNATDKTGGMHEEGFASDHGKITNAPPGTTARPGDDKATIVVPTTADTSLKVHVHPEGSGNMQFQQEPSATDRQNVDQVNHPNMTNAVVGAGSGQVYIYDDKGVKAHVPLTDFPRQ